ncbi:MAG: hypothetical protein A2Z42_04405 [Candidatus Woykebacteria bacterium RBG_19FT_COMBO_43_10]|uniref:J domain-containing protein n=1 Tax=Candidatus Woykebacteria bacterium RBG_19FT_COMBO_43_10 TaxID=1802598 RepID=A0A1G1WF76_9BACT|nr:MAG: hypothetical protein A2Z42_04405 [Candidatus Woykebacteria bacterium RBG_19FT_COMBO_43_10]
MSCRKDPYEVLGVSRDAYDAEIKRQWRTLALKYHPDVSVLPVGYATQKAAEINTAYDLLKDAELRAAYDKTHGGPILRVYDVESEIDVVEGKRAIIRFGVDIVSGVVPSGSQLTFTPLNGWLKVRPVKIKSLCESATFPLEVWLVIVTDNISRDVWNEGKIEIQVREVVS